MKRIGVFCASSEKMERMYYDAAYQLGNWIGETGRTLVYGGANCGMMECVAKAQKKVAARSMVWYQNVLLRIIV